MHEQVLLVFREVRWHSTIQLSSQRLVKGRGRDSKGQRLDHVIHKVEIRHLMKNGGKLHKHLLRLDTGAQRYGDLVEDIFVEFSLLIVELLDELLHDFSEVVLILPTEHADQVDLQLSEVMVSEVDRVDLCDIDVPVGVNEVSVEALEDVLVPLYHYLPSVTAILCLCRL